MADFNGDGIPDLAVPGGAGMSILLGNGNGTFRPALSFTSGYSLGFVAVGDFNGDGKQDLVVTNFYQTGHGVILANDVRVFLGNGDGTFKPAGIYNTGLGPRSVAVADFNGNGIPDLAVVNGGGFAEPQSTVSILLGKGDGTFHASQDYAVGWFASSVAVADFNRDGHIDLAVANFDDDTVSILLGNADGTFQAAQNYAVPQGGPVSVGVGDFNGDGILDLALGNYSSGVVSVLLGNGDGTFQAGQSYAVASFVGFVVVADFNRDGHLDIAVANRESGTVSVLLGNGDGTFQTAQTYAAGTSPNFLAAGDFNGDGYPDLAVANSNYAATATVLINAADW